MFAKKFLFTGFSPNDTSREVARALKFLLFPWQWSRIIAGSGADEVEKKLRAYLPVGDVICFDSGRTALYFAIKYLNLRSGQEVLVQAYTCVVVINSIKAAGGTPVYVDIDNDFNMNTADAASKISDRTRAIIIQHTFGAAATGLDNLLGIARRHGLFIIEDCAHSLGATDKGRKLGTVGDVAVFSFGSDKIISGVRGGALAVKDSSVALAVRGFQNQLPTSRFGKTIQHLIHIPVFFVGKKLYGWGIGKVILFLASKFNIVNKIIYPAEKRGEAVDFYPARMPNSLALLLLDQLDNLDANIVHRRKIAKIYSEQITNKNFVQEVFNPESTYLRYPMLVNGVDEVLKMAKKSGIILGDWYSTVITPQDVDVARLGYKPGSCPRAEQMAKLSINLPTDVGVNPDDAARIVGVINSCKI